MKFIVQIEMFCFVINFQLVKSQSLYQSNGTIYVNYGNETATKPQQTPVPEEKHHSKPKKHMHQKEDNSDYIADYTFVAIIEILFSDGSRKKCTGAIIHNNVVITAAHCFEKEQLNTLHLELTGSFVIIGTKYMFDTGYEQYLPIERVLIHPDYKGWKANIALVYTFAGMMSDKPGNIIPLAEGNAFTSLYSNVTVLNWNQIDEKENMLIIEDYIIFEIQPCQRLVRKLKPAFYQIENTLSSLCYSKKSGKNIQANSGALAVHRNNLIGIAIGDLYNGSNHIIVGTKLSCYCTWIGENLPADGNQMLCSENVCSEKYFKSKQQIYIY